MANWLDDIFPTDPFEIDEGVREEDEVSPPAERFSGSRKRRPKPNKRSRKAHYGAPDGPDEDTGARELLSEETLDEVRNGA